MKKRIAHRIVCQSDVSQMGFAIQFNNQFLGEADKVGDVRTDRRLTAKMQFVRCLELLQVLPQFPLGRCLFATKTLRGLPGFWRNSGCHA